MKFRNVLITLGLFSFILGSASASGVGFDASALDVFEAEEAYVDFVLDGDTLLIILDDVEGALPATMTSDFLPLEEDSVDETLLDNRDAMALYVGLPVSEDPFSVTVRVEGNHAEVAEAVLARLAALGITCNECFIGGPIASYNLTSDVGSWSFSMYENAAETVLHIRATY